MYFLTAQLQTLWFSILVTLLNIIFSWVFFKDEYYNQGKKDGLNSDKSRLSYKKLAQTVSEFDVIYNVRIRALKELLEMSLKIFCHC